MDLKSFISKAHQIEINIRKAINARMHGNYNSIFKGSGLEFNDLRPYQYGDDVRHIDWNTSAKGHGTYVKLFKEEKEQTVFFLLDSSASMSIGLKSKKLDLMKELAAVLALSAIQEASHLGFACFSDKSEKFIAPAPGKKHGYRVLSELFKFEPEHTGTDLKAALGFTLQVLKKKSLIILISDFLGDGYEDVLKAAAKKHDLVIIQLLDKKEQAFPAMGILPLFDPETQRRVWVNTSSARFRKHLQTQFHEGPKRLARWCQQMQVAYCPIENDQDYLADLIQLFKVRG